MPQGHALPRFLHPFAKPTREQFITVARGEGARIYDAAGNEYIDGMASLWYCAIGHGRREMADAIARQITTIEAYSAFDPFTTRVADELCERISALSPLVDSRVFLCNSGSEAVDSAMKLARLAHVQAGRPERTLIISRGRGYHGTNYGGTSAQGIPPNRAGYGPLVGDVIHVEPDDIEGLAKVMADNSERLAAVISEPVQGAGGVYPPTEGYLQHLRKLCDQHGAYLIFDEVITAFGRLGTWFGAQHYGVTPDLLTFAKAVTSGYQPLGGVIVAKSVREPIEADGAFLLRHGYTYSGHATACAAALANLDIMEREGLLERAVHIGRRLESGLGALAADGTIDHARGRVAVWAAGHLPGVDPFVVRDRMLAAGSITRALNTDTNSFCPPLVITDAELDRLIDTFATVTTAVVREAAL
ncbi:MAG: aminotransferase class III-fold pyridoxal phosphate-dependent enzyme [Acidobacteria bacterium]|nr:aminotransferase class III-fold pyridoxal phosphate-dependent enzyme [Acidobacteriota bacterium]